MSHHPRLADLLARPTTDFLFFWGHRPTPDGSVGKSCLSQWWPSPTVIDGERYLTAEHYMMTAKARLFDDEATAEAVLASHTPEEAKALGRKVRGFTEPRWREHRYDIVVRANEAKFSQHPRLAAFLRSTGTAVLVEASPVDPVWGIGLAATSPDARRPSAWPGLNLLGFALMDVRDRLRRQVAGG
ncbi:NADAR family protein [Actinokineospora iranica]|uniref:NADAR domain-containing protein n=1 Tax=Actinokineospora iranica TaxID=1271860 RepID=A0A1G6TD87_9PSEU|nr:NADAR family protein [Actinokineospora iranica]SDD27102.1 hypothetical protein SAMN05216174_10993 [Actinokineospora iranica]